ncbi:ABC transporter permease [Paenibacillus riograndensis]|nr:ABC transporter permease [Paenibacillus riograndensis]
MKFASRLMKGDRVGLLFVLPAVAFMLFFTGYPIIRNIIMSFQNIDVMTLNLPHKEFVGLGNYKGLFADPLLGTSLYNTLYYTVFSIAIQFVIGFMLALFFNKNFGLSKKVRGLILIPWMIPATITALVFKYMFSASGGIVDQILMDLHITNGPVEWLLHPVSAMWSLILTNSWIGVPFTMIMLLTGLTTIPSELYESASIDGASRWGKLRHITLPLLRPSIEAVLILGFISTFKVFDLVYVMTKGGPVDATETLSTLSYKLSFSEFNFCQGAAVANILFAILFVVSLAYLKLVKEDEVM